MALLEFCIDLILPVALWPRGRTSLQQKREPTFFTSAEYKTPVQNAIIYHFSDITLELVKFSLQQNFVLLFWMYFLCKRLWKRVFSSSPVRVQPGCIETVLTLHSLVMSLHTLCMTSADLQRESWIISFYSKPEVQWISDINPTDTQFYLCVIRKPNLVGLLRSRGFNLGIKRSSAMKLKSLSPLKTVASHYTQQGNLD